MKYEEKLSYWYGHIESLRRCKSHLLNSLKIIDFEISSCEKKIVTMTDYNSKPEKEMTQDEIVDVIEAINYKPEY